MILGKGRVLKYFKETSDFGIKFTRSDKFAFFDLKKKVLIQTVSLMNFKM